MRLIFFACRFTHPPRISVIQVRNLSLYCNWRRDVYPPARRGEQMPTLSRILVPVDFSPRCRGAVEYAEALSCHFHCEIVLLHVISPPLPVSDSARCRFYPANPSPSRVLPSHRAAGNFPVQPVRMGRRASLLSMMIGAPSSTLFRRYVRIVMPTTDGITPLCWAPSREGPP